MPRRSPCGSAFGSARSLPRGACGHGGDDTLAADFTRRYPAGFFAQRAAFASGGRLRRVAVAPTRCSSCSAIPSSCTAGCPRGSPANRPADVNAAYSAALRDYLGAFEALVAAGVLHSEDGFVDRPAIADRYLADPQRAGAAVSASVRAAVDRLRELTRSDVFGASAVYWYRGTVSCSEPIERDRLFGRSRHARCETRRRGPHADADRARAEPLRRHGAASRHRHAAARGTRVRARARERRRR